jgi:hypothetical protein
MMICFTASDFRDQAGAFFIHVKSGSQQEISSVMRISQT